MRFMVVLIALVVFAALTGGAYMASASGWGLPGRLDQPVSIRQESVGTRHARGHLLYFGSSRRHYGGGFRGGK